MKRYIAISLLLTMTLVALSATGWSKETAKADKLKVISVADAYAEPASYDGQLAIEGTVVAVDAKARSFEILTPNPPGSCTSECCAPKRLPVKVPSAAFKGELPAKDKKVVVVGNFEALTKGFKFDPTEVKSGGKVILSKK